MNKLQYKERKLSDGTIGIYDDADVKVASCTNEKAAKQVLALLIKNSAIKKIKEENKQR